MTNNKQSFNIDIRKKFSKKSHIIIHKNAWHNWQVDVLNLDFAIGLNVIHIMHFWTIRGNIYYHRFVARKS